MKKMSKTKKDLVGFEELFGRDENWSQIPGVLSQCRIYVIPLFFFELETQPCGPWGEGAALTSVI